MKWIEISTQEAFEVIDNATMLHLQAITGYANEFIKKSQYPQPRKTKMDLINLFQKLFQDIEFKRNLYNKLCSTQESKELYYILLWKQKQMSTEDAKSRFAIDLEHTEQASYEYGEYSLLGAYSLISKVDNWNKKTIFINARIRPILKLLHPLPDDFEIKIVENPDKTKFTYNNEAGVLSIINTIEDMLKINLIEFGKTAEKPLAKSLNILKSSSASNEFYSMKSMDTLSVDMLTRSFSFYYWSKNKFMQPPQATLKKFLELQLEDGLNFTISRTFLTHLRGIKFGVYYKEQKGLFRITKEIIQAMPKDGWVAIGNIINYCNYKDYRIDFDAPYTTNKYYMEIDGDTKYSGDNKKYVTEENYNVIFFEPILKGMFFYLGALGVVELKYNEPTSSYILKAKEKPYISVWDSLKYIKLTELGKYVFGYNKTYEAKEFIKKETQVKFDEYKPIITVDKNDTITIAKLEPYTNKIDDNKYILSYNKIFRDCNTHKALELKIDGFYKQIYKKPPKIFHDFFDEIKAKANMLKKDSSQVVIELHNDKKLLNLFMTNKKLQEIVIKASGYRVLVSKDDMPKLIKIIKDNGFFVEF